MNDVEMIEISLETAKAKVEAGEALIRLSENRDFKNLILDKYFEKEAIRLVHIKSEPALQTEENQKYLADSMTGISMLKAYLRGISQEAESAKLSMAESEEELEAALLEQNEGENA